MVNTAFAHKFTTPCKLKQMRHLPRRRFPPRFHFFAPNLPWANLCKSNFSCSDERGRNVIMLEILLYSDFWLAESQFARTPEPPVNDSILSFSWFVNILILKTCKRKKKLFFLYGGREKRIFNQAFGFYNYVLLLCFRSLSFSVWFPWCFCDACENLPKETLSKAISSNFFVFVSLWTVCPHVVGVWLYHRVVVPLRILSNLSWAFLCLEILMECHFYFWVAFEKHRDRWSSWVMFFAMVMICEKEILTDLMNLLRLKKRKKLQFIVVLRVNYFKLGHISTLTHSDFQIIRFNWGPEKNLLKKVNVERKRTIERRKKNRKKSLFSLLSLRFLNQDIFWYTIY